MEIPSSIRFIKNIAVRLAKALGLDMNNRDIQGKYQGGIYEAHSNSANECPGPDQTL